MKTTDKIMIQVLIISALLTGGLYWWIPDMHWGVYLGAWFVLSALGYQEWTKHAANEKQANQGDTADTR
jgi:membrane protein implicated in regulation of membrane protease activity